MVLGLKKGKTYLVEKSRSYSKVFEISIVEESLRCLKVSWDNGIPVWHRRRELSEDYNLIEELEKPKENNEKDETKKQKSTSRNGEEKDQKTKDKS